MAVFPAYSSVKYRNPLTEELEFKTLRTGFDDLGEERTKRKWLYPKRNIALVYSNLTIAQAKTLYNFYVARSGSFDAFVFFYYASATYTGEYVGTGDGSTTIFNLPCKTSTARTLYSDGVTLSEGATGADYAFSALGGTDGEDKITFSVAPASGQRITLDFTGILKIRCRFAEDKMSFQTFHNKITSTGVQLRGLLNT